MFGIFCKFDLVACVMFRDIANVIPKKIFCFSYLFIFLVYITHCSFGDLRLQRITYNDGNNN